MKHENTTKLSAAGAQNNVPLAALFTLFAKFGISNPIETTAFLPKIETELVENKKWISKEDFDDLSATALSMPGSLPVNLAICIGHRLQKAKGVVAAFLGTIVPWLAIILLIAMLMHAFADVTVVAAMLRGIRPAVVALVAVPTFSLAKRAKISLINCWIPLCSAFLIWALGVNPIWILLVAGIGGYIYGKFIMPVE